MEPPVAIEVDQSSALIAWQRINGALNYELQMKCLPDNDIFPLDTSAAKSGDSSVSDADGTLDTEWKVLSSSLRASTVRKGSLRSGYVYL